MSSQKTLSNRRLFAVLLIISCLPLLSSFSYHRTYLIASKLSAEATNEANASAKTNQAANAMAAECILPAEYIIHIKDNSQNVKKLSKSNKLNNNEAFGEFDLSDYFSFLCLNDSDRLYQANAVYSNISILYFIHAPPFSESSTL